MDIDTIQKRVEYIKTVRKAYLSRLSTLEENRRTILNNFSEVLKNKKIEEIQKSLHHRYGL